MSRKTDLTVALLLPLLVCVQPALPLPGQTPELRYERLLLALVDGAGGEVLLGEVPNGFPVEILPAGTEILGTAITRFQTVAAVAVPLREPAAEAALRRALLDSGWAYAEQMSWHGFVSADAPILPPPDARPPIFCRGEQQMRLTTRRAEDATTVQFHWSTGPAPHWCTRTRTAASWMPILRAPESVRFVRGGGTSGGDHLGESSAFAATELSPSELVEHFAEQLAAAGWDVGGRVDENSFASLDLTMRDESGSERVGLLSATRMPGGRWVALRLVVMQPDQLRVNLGAEITNPGQ